MKNIIITGCVILIAICIMGIHRNPFKTSIDYVAYKLEMTSSDFSKATYEDFVNLFYKYKFKKCKYFSNCYSSQIEEGRINFIYSCKGNCRQNHVLSLNGVNMLLNYKDYNKMREFLNNLEASPKPKEIKNYFNKG